MRSNTCFKLSNSLVCIGFTQSISTWINENTKSNITNIHIFVFDVNDININCIKLFSNFCRRAKIKFIIHCFNKEDIKILKMKLKKVNKDKYFHFQKNDEYMISFSKTKRLYISYRKVKIEDITIGLSQNIAYEYKKEEEK